MTDAEMHQLAQIERQLSVESPELRRLFDDAAVAEHRRRRRAWWLAGLLTVLAGLALLGFGVGLGIPGLAVGALCPPIAFGVVLLGAWLAPRRLPIPHRPGPHRPWPGRRR